MRSRPRVATVAAIAFVAVVGGGIANSAARGASSLPDDPTLDSCPRLGKPVDLQALHSAGVPTDVVPPDLLERARLTGVRCSTHSEYGIVGITFMFTPRGQDEGGIEIVVAPPTPAREAFVAARQAEIEESARVRPSAMQRVDLKPAMRETAVVFAATTDSRPLARELMDLARNARSLASIGGATWN